MATAASKIDTTANASQEWYDAGIEGMYNQMLEDLRSALENQYGGNEGSLASFVRAQAELGNKFNQANLYRVFVRNQGQEMGLETYVRLCRTLNIGGARMQNMRLPKSNITLLDYLYMDNDIIMKSLPALKYYEAR